MSDQSSYITAFPNDGLKNGPNWTNFLNDDHEECIVGEDWDHTQENPPPLTAITTQVHQDDDFSIIFSAAPTTIFQNQTGISTHAFNYDCTMLALCPNDSKVKIYDTRNWELLHSSKDDFDGLVTSVDWSPISNIVVAP